MSFANKLKTYRNNMELTQDELAEKIGVSQKTISSWEVGRSEPTMKEFKRLCKLFDCTLADLSDTKERPVGDISMEDIYAKVPTLDFGQLQELKSFIDNQIQTQAQLAEILHEKARLESQLRDTEAKLKYLKEKNNHAQS